MLIYQIKNRLFLWKVPSTSGSGSGSGVHGTSFVQSVQTFSIRMVGIGSQVMVGIDAAEQCNFLAISMAMFQ